MHIDYHFQIRIHISKRILSVPVIRLMLGYVGATCNLTVTIAGDCGARRGRPVDALVN
jgi:hypothetical protein